VVGAAFFQDNGRHSTPRKIPRKDIMAHDFAKTRRRAAPEQARQKQAPTPPARNMLFTGLITGAVLGFFSFFLIYLSGVLPPVGNMSAEAVASNAAEQAAAQQRRNEELEQAATRLQLEFYKELPNYELIVDNMPQASAATVVATTGAQSAPTPVAVTGTAGAIDTALAVQPPESGATVIDAMPQPAATLSAVPAEVPTDVQTEMQASTALVRESGFMIQAGAFQQENSAVAQSDRLLGLGLFSRVKQEALLGKTLFLVQVGPFDTREQVAQAEGILRSNGIDSIRMGLSP
jgi:cell division protein FtsN